MALFDSYLPPEPEPYPYRAPRYTCGNPEEGDEKDDVSPELLEQIEKFLEGVDAFSNPP